MNCLRIHSGDDFLRPFVDVVFHRGNLGLGVEQIGVRVNGDHVTHGRLVCQLVGLHIFVYYRTNRAAAEFIACPSGYTIHLFRKADLFKISPADSKSTIICHALDLTGDFLHSKTGDRRGAAKRQILSSPSKENRGIVPLRYCQIRVAIPNRQHMLSVEYLAF